MAEKTVTRFAPSPTGFMHIGGVRTALFAWLWARKNKGTFILRIEDTDKEREVEGSIPHIIESLTWLGIEWDEGPDSGGAHAPYLQSERLDSYKKYAKILIEKGLAYPDPYTKEELEAFRKLADENKQPFLYRNHRPETFGVWDGTQALRFKTPEIKSCTWQDAVRGELSAGPEALDDFILIKSDGYPTYNFAHIIDDLEMGVTHIMRADEFIASTPKFLSLYDALGITAPVFVTLPPILGEGGNKKLSKRDGAKDILEYKAEGYLPEAMMNFLALLGWNPGTEQEIFTPEQLIQAFDISRIQTSGAQVNLDKLDWMNKEHMNKLSPTEQEHEVFKRLPTELRFKEIVPIVMERISKWSDIGNEFLKENIIKATTKDNDVVEWNTGVMNVQHPDSSITTSTKNQNQESSFLSSISRVNDYLVPQKDPYLQKAFLIPKELKNNPNKVSMVKEYLKVAINYLENGEWDKCIEKNDGEDNLWTYSGKEGRGKVLWPIRQALSGQDRSLEPFEIMKIIGRETSIRRINKALSALEKDGFKLDQ